MRQPKLRHLVSIHRSMIMAGALLCLVPAQPSSAEEGAVPASNPLLGTWNTPYSVPPFDEIENTDYLPALRAAIEAQQAEIAELVANPEAPTFANTIEALERSGGLLDRVSNVFSAVNSANSDDTIRETARVISPELAAHRDAIHLDRDLFARVQAVHDRKDALDLSVEQERLLEETYKEFVRSGAALPEASQERLRQVNRRMAELAQTFGQNLLEETNDFDLHVTDRADLGDLPASLVATAEEEAHRRGHEGGWSFTLQRPSCNPFLQYSPNRELRRRVFEGYAMRANRGNEYDNNEVLLELANLRVERAHLLGYPSHAAYVLSDNMAQTPERVYELLDRVWAPTLRAAKAERARLTELLHADGIEGRLRGWDWRYYAEKLRRAEYDLDEEQTRAYFEVDAVRDGVFAVAHRLYGLDFLPLADMPRWHEDQQVCRVNEADGSLLGIVYLDFFARESKRGGAWMNDLRAQWSLDGDVRPVVTTNFNFPPPTENAPSLLSFSEATTLFHEFGHALHGLLSDVTYRSLSGTNVPRDFVEFPSQVMENWMSEPEVLRIFARDYRTGEVIPEDLVEKIQASRKFNQGFATAEFMAACYLDMAWHTLEEPTTEEPGELERQEMQRIGMIDEIVPRYRNTYFAHIFSGGYSAGYYSYLWSEVLDADAFQAFKETSLFDPDTAARFRTLLAAGGTVPGMDLYRAFRGRDPEIGPLLERRGLTE
jgi:peptidyl-dipeptidase Dcp